MVCCCAVSSRAPINRAAASIFNRDRKDFRLKPRSVAHFARFACHKRANAVTSEFALGLFIKPLHLRHESFERFRNFLFSVIAEAHFNRRPIRAEVKGLSKSLWQVAEGNVFIDMKVFYERL